MNSPRTKFKTVSATNARAMLRRAKVHLMPWGEGLAARRLQTVGSGAQGQRRRTPACHAVFAPSLGLLRLKLSIKIKISIYLNSMGNHQILRFNYITLV